MASVIGGGPFKWKLVRDNDTEREYKATYRVSTSGSEGPYAAMSATGIPATGDSWNYHESDTWAYCLPEKEVEPEVEGEDSGLYHVTCTFSTKPFTRCATTEKGNPLLEPIKITGTFQKYTKAVWQNIDGSTVHTSSLEVIRGSEMDFDFNRPTVKIEMNVGTVQQNLLTRFVDCVNSTIMWGFAPRCIKLSNVSWERLFYGVCNCYFRWSLEFDIKYDSFDKFVVDEGTKCLRGHWKWNAPGPTGTNPDNFVWVPDLAANPNNPRDFIRYTDCFGNPSKVLLDGKGNPAEVIRLLPTGTGTALGTGTGTGGSNAKIPVYIYPGVNFALLGIPTVLTCAS